MKAWVHRGIIGFICATNPSPQPIVPPDWMVSANAWLFSLLFRSLMASSWGKRRKVTSPNMLLH
jgi:hypothetical protein